MILAEAPDISVDSPSNGEKSIDRYRQLWRPGLAGAVRHALSHVETPERKPLTTAKIDQVIKNATASIVDLFDQGHPVTRSTINQTAASFVHAAETAA